MKPAANFESARIGVELSPRPNSPNSTLRDYFETLFGAVLIAAVIVLFIARAFTVDGPSMLPTLHGGERILVDQISYRFREPRRGEIVVFRYPSDPSQFYVKRVVGLPGDRVAIRNGRLSVNGVDLKETYISERHTSPDYGPVVVPAEGPNEGYFVLGDHRDNSEDSRMASVGFVPRENIVGRAAWRFWPLADLAVLQAPPSFQGVATASPTNAAFPSASAGP